MYKYHCSLTIVWKKVSATFKWEKSAKSPACILSRICGTTVVL